MKVFLDVGAHVGETLKSALDPRYAFDRIVCFEPVASCWPALERLADERVEICTFGLANATSRAPIYDAGSLGASFLHSASSGAPTELAELRGATEWFQMNVTRDDTVYLKLNCEGSECDILDDLLESGEVKKIRTILVDFDVRKIPELAYREHEVIEHFAHAGQLDLLSMKERYKGPTHTATIENWLRAHGAVNRRPTPLWTLRFVWVPVLVRQGVVGAKDLVRRLLPQRTYGRLRRLIQRFVYGYPPDTGRRDRAAR